jgi:hypothetical protein
MKNSALHVRSIDEGAMDEQSGMNFSEYIAILSGDTSLLEKSKIEKKIAVMESLKGAHYREISRSKFRLDNLFDEKERCSRILEKLITDETLYKSGLRFEKDGTKSNPIEISGLNTNDPEAIGKWLINLHRQFKPENVKEGEKKIGTIYGFDVLIRSSRQFSVAKNDYFSENDFYAVNPKTGIKYSYTGGQPNIDNPKLAARHFLNAIDRVIAVRAQQEESLKKIEQEIPILKQIISKPFVKEEELKGMKLELSGLERTISIKIQENQMKQITTPVENADLTETQENGMRTAKTIFMNGSNNLDEESEPEEIQSYHRVRRRGR